MARQSTNLFIGLFVILGVVLGVVAIIWVGATSYFQKGDTYISYFDESVQGLQVDSSVKFRGVEVGRVEAIKLTPGDRAKIVLRLEPDLKLRDDAIASIRTKGIIGDKYIKLSPGNSEKTIPPGGKIHDTEAAVEWEELISKYIHGKV